MPTTPGSMPSPLPGCPKRMVFGPCGGVRSDGACEMAAMPCVFGDLDRPPSTTWPSRDATRTAVAPPLVLTDLSAPPADVGALEKVAGILAPDCDAVLVGDHQDRPDFPPTMLARLIADAGAHPWVTLACRDRNRVVLEQELRGLRHEAIATVLCDRRRPRLRRPSRRRPVVRPGRHQAGRARCLDRAAGRGGRDPDRAADAPAAGAVGREATCRCRHRRVESRAVASSGPRLPRARRRGGPHHSGRRLGRRLHRRAVRCRAHRATRPRPRHPEAGACRAAQRLFGFPVVRAGSDLPFATATFDAVWSLGVVCTVPDQPHLLRELHRVLRPEGRLGLLVFVARRVPLTGQPTDNDFPTEDRLRDLLADAHLRIENSATTPEFAVSPELWQERADAVEAELVRRHSDDPVWQTAVQQSELIGSLLEHGELAGMLVVASPARSARRNTGTTEAA